MFIKFCGPMGVKAKGFAAHPFEDTARDTARAGFVPRRASDAGLHEASEPYDRFALAR